MLGSFAFGYSLVRERPAARWIRLGAFALGMLVVAAGTMLFGAGLASCQFLNQSTVYSKGWSGFPGVAIGLVLLLSGIALCGIALFAARRPRENRAPNCANCGYDLTGTMIAGIDRCPECGATISVDRE